jgi:hypothetical protein
MTNRGTSSNTTSSHKVNTAADLARLQNKGKLLNSQELKELNTQLKALEEIARIEDRFRLLENWKHQRPTKDLDNYPGSSNSIKHQEPEHSSSTLEHYLVVRPSIELRDSKSSSLDTIPH